MKVGHSLLMEPSRGQLGVVAESQVSPVIWPSATAMVTRSATRPPTQARSANQ